MRNAGQCIRCKCEVWLPDALYEAAHRAAGSINFYCGYGHPMVFAEGESEEQKLRRERDRLKQQTARLEDEAREARERAERAEAAHKRLKKRTAASTCPCCSRTFNNMSRHMKTKHPEFIAENVVKLHTA